MKRILKNRKVKYVTLFSAVAIAGIILFQGAIPKEQNAPKIDALSPSQGAAGTAVIVSGSGFTSSIQGIAGTKVNGKVYAPGNYVLVQSDIVAEPILSPDGKTLTVRVDLVSDTARKECKEKLSKANPEPCKVQIKVVNAYGKVSNSQYFTITGLSNIPVNQSCLLTVSVAPTTPAAQNISPGQSAVPLVKFNATPNCNGTLNSFAVSLLPMPSGYQNISFLRLYNDVSGVQLGLTQNVTGASVNFASVNTPLTANQALVLRVVGDVSPSAYNGSAVYGVFGGSYGVTGSGGMIGNNASGNIIAGNAMTVQR